MTICLGQFFQSWTQLGSWFGLGQPGLMLFGLTDVSASLSASHRPKTIVYDGLCMDDWEKWSLSPYGLSSSSWLARACSLGDAEFWESGSAQSPSSPRFGTWANCFLCVPLAKAGHNLIPNSDSMREKIHFTSWGEELQSHFAKGYESRKGNN